MQISKRIFGDSDVLKMSTKKRLLREIRSNFLQTFGTTWCIDHDMAMEYSYTDTIYIKICLKNDPVTHNYIWIDLNEQLTKFINSYDHISIDKLIQARNTGELKKDIDTFFENGEEVIYIPAGRSMMTLFSSQLMFMYSVMNDDQKRSLDYCTQNYMERIMQLKPSFSNSVQELIKLN